ncbi:glutamate 2,3-aminomutase [Desulforamulus hydrothermalis]|uniref:L-lysine 2,3-aminomutase n=1 Tax=Desulforamulus hydrothermalis Lam5 = DSM 18033 TaxID=1121428 RepID=K8DWX4_9FIRM|nr:glutamate 2,3-aminomutase [Desulforamulus hydrothermalis]CCO07007.1 L-lysine 2,3-aminomutase [Desulforamulus hydrothermalis Lam5 = DSM 18033]SHG97760.1 glutamate 2,3-aminomutase [Desulforamulus hydrothermalis Lam5 = DSM 18033]
MSVNLRQEEVQLESKKRLIALQRAKELRSRIDGYLKNKANIPSGFEVQEAYQQAKHKLLQVLQATEDQWHDWHWQMANRISDVTVISQLLNLDAAELQAVQRVGRQYRWAVSPYYMALAMAGGINGPVWRQAVPSIEEVQDRSGLEDPMGEEFTSPAPAVTRRYPDRLIINVTNQCAMYCRHCQRRRNIGELDLHKPRKILEAALQYVRENKEIRDVLITGGDALLLSDKQLDWLLSQLDQIPHVEIKRIGTRTPVTLPQRITPELCAVLEKYPPIYINTQFNHPLEVTPEAKKACDMLIKAGVVLGNQAVLLKDINNDPDVMKRLNHKLLQIRVRPYYIFHAKAVKGTRHFITGVNDGINIMEQLRGYTSGLAVPTYIINAPNGYGKTPVLPQYIVENHNTHVTLRTWEKRIIPYNVKCKQ